MQTDLNRYIPVAARHKWNAVSEIVAYAEAKGWTLYVVNLDVGMLRFRRKVDGMKETANFYATTFTITTEINHPKQGKTQLHRKNLSIEQIKEVFSNPRTHTGEGYYKKKQ